MSSPVCTGSTLRVGIKYTGKVRDTYRVGPLLILVTTITSSVPWLEQKPGNRSFSPDFVISHMVPGTAIGVLLGDLVYTWMAFRLARKTGNREVTAMPLGLDTPSTFGMAFLVLLPALQQACI